MSFADRIFHPFERRIAPLDLPVRPMPEGEGAKGALALVWHFASMFKTELVLVGILSIISALISLLLVWALAFIVDGVTQNGGADFVADNSGALIALLVVFALVDPAISFIRQTFLSQTVQTLMPAAMRWQAHKAVERQDVAFFEGMFAGQVASKIAQVTSSVQRQMMVAMQTIPRVTIQFGGSFILLAVLAWPLAVPVLVWIILNGLLAWKVVPLYMARSSKVAAATARATGAMTDVYSNIAMVKLFAAEDSEAGAIRKVIGQTIDTQHHENRTYIISDNAVGLLNIALVIAIFSTGLWGIAGGWITVGEFVAAATVSRSLGTSSYAFIGLGQSVTRTLGTIRDAMPVITAAAKVVDREDAPELKVGTGAIHFDEIGFSYGPKSEKVLDGFDLAIAPGERVGLVGLSGAGKSTLVQLLLRLRDVDDGAVHIDGQDVRHVQQTSLRDNIGVVMQDVSLLHRSIRDNIRYGRPDATDDDIRAAADAAQATEFIESLVDAKGRRGLDAHVGERGVKLSGGQRQRITIARVLLKNAPILVLDEATSALDSEAEAAIQTSLDSLMTGKTTLAIAHRLSTIAAMDRLVVIDKGVIVEEGRHEELILAGGLYAQLWERQSGGFIAQAAALDDAVNEAA
ncbi:ABC transporter ATP-binding protein [Ahrensia sp. R2A130]|uniref:ABC transporter ATP-binding protein n=1 Tax=Ahrensia sp. R2A130 TaxID=744979 RepID=UPI00058FCA09|nr:ABC transporter ATP-binding protein [Ahrensia sp. R2A130]